MDSEKEIYTLQRINEIIDSFNNLAIILMNTVCTSKHSKSKYKYYRSMVKTMLKKKKTFLFNEFLDNIYKHNSYTKRIRSGDDNFFLKVNFEKKIKSKFAKDFIDLKDVYASFTDTDKNSVKLALLMMVECCDEYLKL